MMSKNVSNIFIYIVIYIYMLRMKFLKLFSLVASDVSQIENLYDLEVYGSAENPTSTTITSYTFEVCRYMYIVKGF